MPRPSLPTVFLTVVPWTWFLVRGASPWMDVVAVVLPLVGTSALAVGALTLFVERLGLLRVLAVSTALMSGAAIVAPRLPLVAAGAESDLTVVAANLTGDNPEADVAIDRLLAAHPDVLILEEANAQAQSRYPDIEATLHYRKEGRTLEPSRAVVFSRYPLTPIELPDEIDTGRIVAVRVEGPQPFIVVGAHLPRPWFRADGAQMKPPQRQQLIEAMADWLSELEDPVIFAGDLNSTDRGVGYRTLTGRADLVDAMRVEWASTTSTKWWPLLLRIDHVLVRGICPVSAGNTAVDGSDHRSVVAELEYCQ